MKENSNKKTVETEMHHKYKYVFRGAANEVDVPTTARQERRKGARGSIKVAGFKLQTKSNNLTLEIFIHKCTLLLPITKKKQCSIQTLAKKELLYTL